MSNWWRQFWTSALEIIVKLFLETGNSCDSVKWCNKWFWWKFRMTEVFWGENSPYKMTIIRCFFRQGLFSRLICKYGKLNASFGMGVVDILLNWFLKISKEIILWQKFMEILCVLMVFPNTFLSNDENSKVWLDCRTTWRRDIAR